MKIIKTPTYKGERINHHDQLIKFVNFNVINIKVNAVKKLILFIFFN